MFALDEIQRGDTRRERIDGGIASRRFEKSRTMGQRKLKYGRRRGNGPLRPDTHPWHVKLSVLRSANFRSMDPTIVEPIRFPFPTSLASYIRACICPWKWQNYRTTTVHVTGIMSVGCKEISNQIWEQLGGSRIRLSDPCFRCFAGKHHFHDRRNDFLSKAKLYSRTYMVMYFQGLFVYISARSCHVIVLSSTNKRE